MSVPDSYHASIAFMTPQQFAINDTINTLSGQFSVPHPGVLQLSKVGTTLVAGVSSDPLRQTIDDALDSVAFGPSFVSGAAATSTPVVTVGAQMTSGNALVLTCGAYTMQFSE